MSLPDTAEYWWGVKAYRPKHTFVHIKGKPCGHFHVIESKELNDIDCYACKKIIESDEKLKSYLEKNNGLRLRNHRKKKGFKFESTIKFGKHKGKTIKEIIEIDLNYFKWLKDKIVLHPELDNI
jgi:ribosomal protein S27E